MKNTKKIILGTSLFLALGVGSASAETYELWVNGVDQYSGWSDFDKSGGGDSQLCWAAAASNIIDWWQKQYVIPDNIPQGEDIWKMVKSTFEDKGGMPYNAITWWLDGRTGAERKEGADELGMYYIKQWDYSKKGADYVTNPIFRDEDSYETCSATIINQLKAGCGMTLALNCQHEVTLWGVEYNESNLITKIWITDSDDRVDRLIGVRCNGSTGKITLNGEDYSAYDREDINIYGYTVLMPADFLTPIPEPSVFGLLTGLGALVLVASRRKQQECTVLAEKINTCHYEK